MEEVCTTYKLAVEFSFGATESMTDPHYDYSHPDGYKRPWYLHSDKHYDTTSIMHYSSTAVSMDKAELLKRKFGSPEYKRPTEYIDSYNAKIIPHKYVPSELDKGGVIWLYPWGKSSW